MGHYVSIEVETFVEGSEVRVRPRQGGPFPQHMYVACNKKMRMNYPVGTVFRLEVQQINRADGSKYLFCPHTADYKVVSEGPRL